MIDGKTIIYGIIGCPVEHSWSPAMHNAALAKLGLNAVYVPFCPPPQQLKQAVEGIKALGIAGVNVTVPYKETVIPFLDDLSDSAKRYGAVNTIVHRQGLLVGHNTDGAGFIKALQENCGYSPAKGTAVLLGAGGAARAVAMALAESGCPEIIIVNRNYDRAADLTRLVFTATGVKVQPFAWALPNKQLHDLASQATLIVNCTPFGMASFDANSADQVVWPLPDDVPGVGQLACDLVYNPPVTPFLKRAADLGAATTNGLGMLLYQGVLALELWTGQKAPVPVMQSVLENSYVLL